MMKEIYHENNEIDDENLQDIELQILDSNEPLLEYEKNISKVENMGNSNTIKSSNLHSINVNVILSCSMFTLCSIGMILINKAIPLTVPIEYRFKLPNTSIILFQCLLAVIFIEISRFFQIIECKNMEWDIIKQWIPVNFFFVIMLLSGFASLVYVSVPMVTIFKNIANLFTVFGDWLIFNEK